MLILLVGGVLISTKREERKELACEAIKGRQARHHRNNLAGQLAAVHKEVARVCSQAMSVHTRDVFSFLPVRVRVSSFFYFGNRVM